MYKEPLVGPRPALQIHQASFVIYKAPLVGPRPKPKILDGFSPGVFFITRLFHIQGASGRAAP